MTHDGIKDQKCPLCNKCFSLKCSLKKHIRIVHNNEKSICTICGKMISEAFIKQHMASIPSIQNVNNKNPTMKCPICQKVFAIKNMFDKHMNTHTGTKPYKCKHCGQGFADSSNKINHEKAVHEGIKRSQKR